MIPLTKGDSLRNKILEKVVELTDSIRCCDTPKQIQSIREELNELVDYYLNTKK